MYSQFNEKISMNNYVDQVIVLCLPKRNEYITNVLNKMGITFTIFNAILGDTIDKDELITNGIISTDNNFKNNNEIACALGHLSIIKEYLDNLYMYGSICVLEDDLKLNEDYNDNLSSIMSSLPEDFEFLNLSRCWAKCNSEKKINEYINITKDSLCSSCYIVNKKGAKKIMDNVFPMKDPIDIYISNLMNEPVNLKFYSSKRLFTQNREQLNSSLDNNDYCMECNDFNPSYFYTWNNFFLIMSLSFIFFILFYNYKSK